MGVHSLAQKYVSQMQGPASPSPSALSFLFSPQSHSVAALSQPCAPELQEFSAKSELTGSHGAYRLGLGAAGAQHLPCSWRGGGAGPASSEQERSSPASAGKTNVSLVRSPPRKAWRSDSFLCCNNAIQKTIGIV